ncbi:peptidoglycan-binding protein [Algicella marina]|uniref:Caspase family p20 domain-containing protein n=1 Tax=Algicella marina TaxID=2683284 RepID=A0A6P1T2Y8_9RHOB|nr:peptidoglycan-binding protein [Algicella marina]QHQ36111.1 hypothetical protein GO499_13490 [Algicella marina]
MFSSKLTRRLAATTALALSATLAQAQDVALIISNPATLRGSLSENVDNGHADLVSLYRDMGYEVTQGRDLSRSAIRRMLSDFSREVEDGDGRIVIHFSGRAVTIGNETLLVPADMSATERTGVIFEAVPLTALLSTATSGEGDAAVILALNSMVDPEFEEFATRPFDVDAPENALVVYGNAGAVNEAVRQDFLTLGLSATEVESRNKGVTLKGKVTDDMLLVPAGRNRDTGLKFAQDMLWQMIATSEDRVLIEAYLRRFPNGPHAEEAKSMLGNPAERNEQAIGLTADDRKEIQRHLTILGYDTRGIDGIFGRGTRGSLRSWQETRGLDVTGYLRQPQLAMLESDADARRKEIREAEWQRKRADTEFWQATGKNDTKPELLRYLKRYPNGVHSKQANRMLNQIRKQEEQSARSEDRDAWQAAQQDATIAAYRAYLQANPDGRFRDRAEEQIAELRDADDRQARRAAFRSEEDALGLSQDSIRTLERRLTRLEFEPGPVDGTVDQDTRRAVRQFQSSQELEVTGFFNQGTVQRLLAVSDDD